MGNVVISPNIKKTKVQIDANGNEVKPFSKDIITPTEQPYVPTQAEVASVQHPVSTLSIQDQIEQAEKLLADLRLKKLEEIARMKAELAKLEAT